MEISRYGYSLENLQAGQIVHIESIIERLKAANQPEWAHELYGSLYVSQSFTEICLELLPVLTDLNEQKICKELGLKKDVKKALTFIKSFGYT